MNLWVCYRLQNDTETDKKPKMFVFYFQHVEFIDDDGVENS